MLYIQWYNIHNKQREKVRRTQINRRRQLVKSVKPMGYNYSEIDAKKERVSSFGFFSKPRHRPTGIVIKHTTWKHSQTTVDARHLSPPIWGNTRKFVVMNFVQTWRVVVHFTHYCLVRGLMYPFSLTNHLLIENHRSLIQICITPSLESTAWFIPSASPVMSRLTSSFTCQLISVIIPTLVIHHSFTLSLQAQNLPFQQILPTLDLFYLSDCLHDNGTETDLSCSSFLFLVSHFNFLFVPCGGLSWLPVSFYCTLNTLSYRIVCANSKLNRYDRITSICFRRSRRPIMDLRGSDSWFWMIAEIGIGFQRWFTDSVSSALRK